MKPEDQNTTSRDLSVGDESQTGNEKTGQAPRFPDWRKLVKGNVPDYPVAKYTKPVAVAPVGDGNTETGGTIVSRRNFLSWLTAGWLAFAAVTATTLIGTVRFLFPNVLFEPPQTFRAGFPEEYTIDDVSTRFKDQFGVWIVRSSSEIYVLSTVCTHLGCTPNWLSGEKKFKCPCHGSGFRKTGINFEGPAPRPLERYRVVMAEDGQILVDKTRKYQWEKGEWSDPESFLAT